ncbi:aminotransferase class V-fold PLP-dependent enzyme [Aquibacillus halophilus]|uniref:cysteine desulfurase n=1 Tax=Aquibacillus halophilus TaxID=930132 RepID=A0A6A8DLJ2_9BACI|nr:cysteine desulfurase family protein [Aquibacillus halophilus]MRH43867.1 aminotransferase class V-fold PLP-dependent enzyme [Aquibacillus halophilus]
MTKIYLDFNASTPIDPEVIDEMTPFFSKSFGNPSSQHWASSETTQAIIKARNQIAHLLGCHQDEIIFTSGGSEANNHALKGVFSSLQHKGNHIITTKVEHPAIMSPCKYLESIGAEVSYVDVDQYGRVDPEQILNEIKDTTILITVMHANNEIGTIQPIEAIGEIASKHRIVFHSDAAQSIGKVPTKVDMMGVDLLSIAGHKLYAPKGIGALYIKRGTSISPFIHGAGHENGHRAGTENTPYIVALGKACELAEEGLNHIDSIRELRNYFWQQLSNLFEERVVLNGSPDNCLPNTLSVSFVGVEGEKILQAIPEIAASTGSACDSGKVELSNVLKAMGVTEHIGMGTIRFSLGRTTTKNEIDEAVNLITSRVLES